MITATDCALILQRCCHGDGYGWAGQSLARGRWPHIHFEVFASVEAAVSGENAPEQVATQTMAIPEDAAAGFAATATIGI